MSKVSNSRNNSDYDHNINLSYDYIEKSIKEIQDINNHTNTEIGLLIGFNFTFIRFFVNELPNNLIDDTFFCYSCLIFKILAYIFSFSSILVCFLGLYKSIEYVIITPEELTDNCDKVPHHQFKLAIIDTWKDKLDSFKKLNSQKNNF